MDTDKLHDDLQQYIQHYHRMTHRHKHCNKYGLIDCKAELVDNQYCKHMELTYIQLTDRMDHQRMVLEDIDIELHDYLLYKQRVDHTLYFHKLVDTLIFQSNHV